MLAPDVTQIITTTVVWLSVALALGLVAMEFVPDLLLQRHHRRARVQAIEQMSPLRIVRMLAFRHLSMQDFVARLKPDEVGQAIANCRSCTNAARCEAVLQGYLPANDYAFCPNRETIGRAAQLATSSKAS